MEQQKTKLNKPRVVMTVINVIMVIVIIILSVVVGSYDKSNDDSDIKPKPHWKVNLSDKTISNIIVGAEYYLSFIPDSYEDVNVSDNDIFNLGDEWRNNISYSINSTLEPMPDDSINMTSTINVNIKDTEGVAIYVINKDVKPNIDGGYDAIHKEDIIRIIGGEMYLNYFIKDQKLFENRITNITIYSTLMNKLKNYNLVIDNNNDGVFDEDEIVENNKVYKQLQKAHNISLRINLLNEWKPKIDLVLK